MMRLRLLGIAVRASIAALFWPAAAACADQPNFQVCLAPDATEPGTLGYGPISVPGGTVFESEGPLFIPELRSKEPDLRRQAAATSGHLYVVTRDRVRLTPTRPCTSIHVDSAISDLYGGDGAPVPALRHLFMAVGLADSSGISPEAVLGKATKVVTTRRKVP